MFLAFVSSVFEAFGKLPVVNMALAGSVVSTPKLIVGTRVWALYVRVTHDTFVPNERLWVPCVQLSVSEMSRYSGLRRLGALVAVALLMPAALMLKLKPP